MNRLVYGLLGTSCVLAVIFLSTSSFRSSSHLGSHIASEAKRRVRRAAYQLPDGVEFLVDPIRTTFDCPGDGYYADMDNNCQLFHVCHSHQLADGRVEMQHHTFACGNQTVFNQLSMTCSFEEDAIPCQSAGEFFYLNQVLGLATEPFLTDTDLQRADEFFGRRVARTQPLPATRSAGLSLDEDEISDEEEVGVTRRRSPAAQGLPRAAALRQTTTQPPSTTPAPTTAAPTTQRSQPLNARIIIANVGSNGPDGARSGRSARQQRRGKDSARRIAASATQHVTYQASPISPSGPLSLNGGNGLLQPGTQIFITRLKGRARA